MGILISVYGSNFNRLTVPSFQLKIERNHVMARKVSGRRVYVTFLKDGTVAIHPSNCRGERYRMRGEGSIHVGKRITTAKLGSSILKVRDACLM